MAAAETLGGYDEELCSDRVLLRRRLAAAAMELVAANERYNRIINELLALNESERQR